MKNTNLLPICKTRPSSALNKLDSYLLWRVLASDDEDALFTPPPTSKRPRHDSKPPSAAQTATELFARDVTSSNTDLFFTTEELEGYFGPSDLTRKRKFTPEHSA